MPRILLIALVVLGIGCAEAPERVARPSGLRVLDLRVRAWPCIAPEAMPVGWRAVTRERSRTCPARDLPDPAESVVHAPISRADVMATMTGIRPRVVACVGQRSHGQLQTRLELAAAGAAVSVAMCAADAVGDDEADCVLDVLCDATLPTSASHGLVFTFPFAY